MGGIHVTTRSTNLWVYKGQEATLRLPKYVSSICNGEGQNIKAEFVFGIARHPYYIDIGVVYQEYGFKLFYHTASNAASLTDDFSGFINASVEDEIRLKVYLSGSNLICEATNSSGNKTSLTCALTNNAKTELAKGFQCIRELLIAADPGDAQNPCNPCNAYFYNAKFSNGVLYKTDGTSEALTPQNSSLVTMVSDGNVNMNILKYSYLNYSPSASTTAAYEEASCDMNEQS